MAIAAREVRYFYITPHRLPIRSGVRKEQRKGYEHPPVPQPCYCSLPSCFAMSASEDYAQALSEAVAQWRVQEVGLSLSRYSPDYF